MASGEPFSRISADGRSVEMLDDQLLKGMQPLGTVCTILPVDGSRIVLGD